MEFFLQKLFFRLYIVLRHFGYFSYKVGRARINIEKVIYFFLLGNALCLCASFELSEEIAILTHQLLILISFNKQVGVQKVSFKLDLQMQNILPVILAHQPPIQLYPLCEGLPKLLLAIEGSTFLQIIVKQIKEAGLSHPILYCRQQDQSAFKKIVQKKELSFQMRNSSTNLLELLKQRKEKVFLLINTTFLTNFSLKDLISEHSNSRNAITLALENESTHFSDIYLLQGNKVINRYLQVENSITVHSSSLYQNDLMFKSMTYSDICLLDRRLLELTAFYPDLIQTASDIIDFCLAHQNNKAESIKTNIAQLQVGYLQVENKIFAIRNVEQLKKFYLTGCKNNYLDPSASILSNNIKNSIVMSEAKIGKKCKLINAVIGPNAQLCQGSVVMDYIIGAHEKVESETSLIGTIQKPQKAGKGDSSGKVRR